MRLMIMNDDDGGVALDAPQLLHWMHRMVTYETSAPRASSLLDVSYISTSCNLQIAAAVKHTP